MTDSLIGARLGKYEIQTRIGRGGAGTVYRAHDPDLNRDVAIKVLAPHLVENQELVERFHREARLAAQLDHPNIVTIYDVGTEGGWHYFVMQYLDGPTLSEIIQEKAPLSGNETLAVLRPLADAIDYAHRHGIVHRDIKPGNIIVNSQGQVKLTDFGIVQASHESPLTITGNILGTPNYMSPEQVEGQSVNGRSDQYSLGVMTYEMLSGQLPFQVQNPGALLYKIAHEQTPPIGRLQPNLPQEVDIVLERVLAKKPEKRFETTRDFVETLARALSREPKESGIQTMAFWRKTPSLFWLLGGLAVLALIWVIVIQAGDSSSEMDPSAPAAASKSTRIIAAEPAQARMLDSQNVEMILVPAGTFVMGSDTGNSFEQPSHSITLDGYWIDMTEVTNRQFAAFVKATGYRTEAERQGSGYVYSDQGRVLTKGANWQHPEGPDSSLDGMEEHPATQISWFDALAYCQWRGVRLPTEAEWEMAARGDDQRTHPWGEGFHEEQLNLCDTNCPFDWRITNQDDGYRFTAPVGTFPSGASPYGLLDMEGNVREWVADWYDPEYYRRSPAHKPSGPASGEMRVVRGSAWNDIEWEIHITDRYFHAPSYAGDDVGFRCAKDLP